MKKTILIIGLICLFPVLSHATIYFHFDAESYSAGSNLPTAGDYNFCTTGCSGDGGTGIVRSTVTAPQGTKYWEWVTVDSQTNAYTEIFGPSFPHTFVSGTWYYLAYYKRFERIGGLEIWANGNADKGVEMRGTGMRWLVSRGRNWGDISGVPTGKYTVWLGNPTYHYYDPLEGSGDELPLNQVGYTESNPLIMDCERWYSIVMGVKASTTSSGEVKLWVNGVLVSHYTGYQTMGSGGTVAYLESGGTIAQPGYNAPPHKRQFDDMILTDNFADVSDWLRDPASGSDETAPYVAITTIDGSSNTSATYSTSSSTVTLAGTATDAVGVTQVQIEWTEGGVPRAELCTGTTSWAAPTIALYSGITVFTVRAYDAANNQGTDTLTVTYSPVVSDTPATMRGVTLRGVRR